MKEGVLLTATDLLSFTRRGRNRSHLSVPFVLGEHTYGCNGHFACRIPGRHVETVGDASVEALAGIFDTAFARTFTPFDPVIAGTRPGDFCRDCSGSGVVVDCDVCNGDGEHECSDDRCGCTHECGACDGKGVMVAKRNEDGAHACDACEGTGRKINKDAVYLGDGLALMWRYLAKVQDLPGPIAWSVPAPEVSSRCGADHVDYGPVAFSGSGWQAIILPCRTNGAEAITAPRHQRQVEKEPA